MQKYTVYLADDHYIVAKGIAAILKQIEAVEQVLIFDNGKKLFQACVNRKPDVVFLDLAMPVWDGKMTLLQLKKEYPSIRCIMLSMTNEKSIIKDCIDSGASGYLNKDCTEQELWEAISSHDSIYYSKSVLLYLSGLNLDHVTPQKTAVNWVFTEREKDVLRLLCDGWSPKEIAEKLFLSVRTVETHKTSIMQKMDVNSIGRLISTALKSNIL